MKLDETASLCPSTSSNDGMNPSSDISQTMVPASIPFSSSLPNESTTTESEISNFFYNILPNLWPQYDVTRVECDHDSNTELQSIKSPLQISQDEDTKKIQSKTMDAGVLQLSSPFPFFESTSWQSIDDLCNWEDEEDSQEIKFFNMDDFEHATWLEVVTSDKQEYISTVGFTAIMAALLIAHPLVFITGAVTAVGLFPVLVKGYDIFSDGFSIHLSSGNSSLPTEDENKKERSVKAVDSECSELEKTQSETDDDSTIAETEMAPLVSLSPMQFKQQACVQDEAIAQHFPPLKNRVMEVEFPGLNAFDFFEVYFSDNAPYSFKEFQETRGDIDIVFGKWKACNESDPVSFHNHAKVREELVTFPHCIIEERTINFKTPTKDYYLGPAYATTKKTQRVTKLSPTFIIIESKTEIFSMPFCDRFYVMERWIVEAKKHNPNNIVRNESEGVPVLFNTKLSVDVETIIIKSCMWENQIKSKSLSALKAFSTLWGEKATQALALTVKKKLERIRNDCNDSEDILCQNKTKAEDLEWSNIEIRYAENGGSNVEVLDRNGLPLFEEGTLTSSVTCFQDDDPSLSIKRRNDKKLANKILHLLMRRRVRH